MKFNPGQTRKVVSGVTYIKDMPKKQVNPLITNTDELQHKQVDEKPVSERSGTSGKSSSTDQSGTSGEPRV